MGANPIYDVSCASPTLCVAVDFRGNAITSTDPTGGAGAWTMADIDGTNAIYGVSCVAPSLCVAGDWVGQVLSSSSPTAGAAAWVPLTVDFPPSAEPDVVHVADVSCPSSTLCLAVDELGNVLSSTDPAGGRAAVWTATSVDGPNYMLGISCPTVWLCVTVDHAGRVVVGEEAFRTHTTPTRPRIAAALAHGLPVNVSCSRACSAAVVVRLAAGASRRAGLSRRRRRAPRAVEIGHATVSLGEGESGSVRVAIGVLPGGGSPRSDDSR